MEDWGVYHAPFDFAFPYFGHQIRANPDLTDLAVMDAVTGLGDTSTGSAATAALRSLAATLVHPDDLELFWSLVSQHRQSTMDLSNVAVKLVEEVTGRPTEQPSDSSAGLSNTDTNSAGDSSSLALRLLEGRPDLQLLIREEQEQQEAG